MEPFARAKRARRDQRPVIERLLLAGDVGLAAHKRLHRYFPSASIEWAGRGQKAYEVFVEGDRFSRPVNVSLFEHDRRNLDKEWRSLSRRLVAAAGTEALDDVSGVDGALYTLLMSAACLADLISPSPAPPGTFMELLIGPVLGVLSGRPETGAVTLEPAPGTFETITVDMKFEEDGEPTLVVPTKLTSRERIVQPYVHQRILDSADPGGFRSILVASSENNVLLKNRRERKTRANSRVSDTLVPGTIALYQRYIAELSGIYYLDPPAPYIDGAYAGLPPIRRVSQLLDEDLRGLLH